MVDAIDPGGLGWRFNDTTAIPDGKLTITHSTKAEILRFQDFVAEKVNQAGTKLTPEDVKEMWLDERPAPDVAAEDLEAVRRAIAMWQAGDNGIPYEDFRRELENRRREAKQP
jgi:hypothetical protein